MFNLYKTKDVIFRRSILPVVIAMATISMSPTITADTAADCSLSAIRGLAPSDTTVSSVKMLQDPAPHCLVEGHVTTIDPGPNEVKFALQLPAPEDWNNRYFFIGLGGDGGYVPYEAQFPNGNPVKAGFATAGTDKGHDKDDPDWQKDEAKLLDNGHRGQHVVSVATQEIARSYYGADRMYRYLSGCSGGGQMGMVAMQLYPEDYDGVLLGWPGGRPPHPEKRGVIDHAIFTQEMLREPGSWISPEKREFVSQKVLEACDATDGAEDGVIWDSRLCSFDFTALECKDGDAADCLTQPEITSFENILQKTSAPISTIADWSYLGSKAPEEWEFRHHGSTGAWESGTALSYIIVNSWAKDIIGPNRDIADEPLSREEMWKILSVRAERANTIPYGRVGLEDFSDTGGKTIFYVGEGDIGSSNLANEQYFRDLWDQMGRDEVDAMAKLYNVPGWGHCGGERGPADGIDRLLDTLISWVEDGVEPEEVKVHRGADRAQFMFLSADERLELGGRYARTVGIQPARDFLLCPFPLVALFDQDKQNVAAAVYEADNWSCVTREEQATVLGTSQ